MSDSPFLNDDSFFKTTELCDNGLLKATGSHKYVRRTGAPGNWKYWYSTPSGKLVNRKTSPTKEQVQHAHDIAVDYKKRNEKSPEIVAGWEKERQGHETHLKELEGKK